MYWLPTPFACFPFTSPPVRHRVPQGSERALQKVVRAMAQAISPASYRGGPDSIPRQSARDLWWTVALRQAVIRVLLPPTPPPRQYHSTIVPYSPTCCYYQKDSRAKSWEFYRKKCSVVNGKRWVEFTVTFNITKRTTNFLEYADLLFNPAPSIVSTLRNKLFGYRRRTVVTCKNFVVMSFGCGHFRLQVAAHRNKLQFTR